MRRRQFIRLLGGAAAAWPLAALTTAERNAETWRTAFEREQAQRALPTPSTNAQQAVQQPEQPAEQPSRLRRTWRWLRTTG